MLEVARSGDDLLHEARTERIRQPQSSGTRKKHMDGRVMRSERECAKHLFKRLFDRTAVPNIVVREQYARFRQKCVFDRGRTEVDADGEHIANKFLRLQSEAGLEGVFRGRQI